MSIEDNNKVDQPLGASLRPEAEVSPKPGQLQLSSDKVYERMLMHRKRWQIQASTLRVLQTSFAVIAMMSSLTITTYIEQLPPEWVRLLAFVTALSAALLGGFDLGSKANRVRRAWRILNAAIMRHEANEYDSQQLIDAYVAAESVHGGVKTDVR
jgi:hypothetical protein